MHMSRISRTIWVITLLTVTFPSLAQFQGMYWKTVGPKAQGGRVEALDVPLLEPKTIYAGYGSGSLWKSTNRGTTWELIFRQEGTFAIGDVASAPSDPRTVWVGTGENLLARSSYAGKGVFKSTDGGTRWRFMGLEDSHHIGRIVIHPSNPDVLYVAALGHQFSFNEERGLFKTADGGVSWEKVLYINEKTGINDVIIDPLQPDMLIASAWEHDRKAWNNVEGGPGSGLYKTTDAGRSWNKLGKGLPRGEIGRIGLEISLADPRVIYAIVDNQNPGERIQGRSRPVGGELYRSDDQGESWRKVNDKPVPGTGYSFCDVRLDPQNPDRVYLALNYLMESSDGGRNFSRVDGTVIHQYPHNTRSLHLDAHEFWVDPADGSHWILGNDGGVYQTFDSGKSWLHHNGMPVAEFYAISVDDSIPYNIYGGTQDNAALYGPAREVEDEVADGWETIWIDLWGGGDSYYTFPDPTEYGAVYFEQQFGDLQRKNLLTGVNKHIKPRPAEGEEIRCSFVTPFLISRHDPYTLYFGANRLYRSINRGENWEAVSPELSTREALDIQGDVPYATITTIAESPFEEGLIYAGTDDGTVHRRLESGNWRRIDEALPDKWVSRVLASRFDKSTVYVTLTGFREDDFTPYVYRSDDFGVTWISLSAGLPQSSVNVILEDPRDPGILYAGCEPGVFVTVDGGKSWHSLQANMPDAAVHDLAIQERELELVAGTHGLSCFVLDISPIPAIRRSGVLRLLPSKPAILPKPREYGGDWILETRRKAIISIFVPGNRSAESTLPTTVTISTLDNEVVKTLEFEAVPGLNQVIWDLEISRGSESRTTSWRGVGMVPAGVYLITVTQGNEAAEGEILVIGG